MEQFVVPQFIEVEAKIIGPISARQFIQIIIGLGFSYAWFRLFSSPLIFIPMIFLTTSIFGALAFGKVNGQTMHYFLLNLLQTLRRPRLKIWFRLPYQEEKEAAQVEEVTVRDKGPITESRLAAVSLIVDTGGAYVSDDRPAGVEVSAMGTPEGRAPEVAPQPKSQEKKSSGEDVSRGINLGV